MNENMHWFDLFFNISLSFFGGIVRLINSSDKDKSLKKYLASAIVGGFAGLMTYLICIGLNINIYMTAFATGVAGYAGDSVLKLFGKMLPKVFEGKLNIKIEEKEEEK